MSTVALLERLLRCAFDADARVLDWLEASGVRDEALLTWQSHILHAQNRWGCRIEGLTDDTDLFANLDVAGMRALRSRATPRLLNALENDLGRRFAFVRGGEECSMTVQDTILQVATHGHHHHGQMATRARQAGLSGFPDTSFIGFVRTNA